MASDLAFVDPNHLAQRLRGIFYHGGLSRSGIDRQRLQFNQTETTASSNVRKTIYVICSVYKSMKGYTGIFTMTCLYIAVFVLAILSVEAQLHHPITSLYKQIDFAHYFASSRLLVDGIDPYTQNLRSYYEQYGFNAENDIITATNPPGLIALFAPLVWLPPLTAYWVWIVIQQFCLFGVLIISMKLLDLRLSHRWVPLLMLGAAVAAPNVANIIYGQTQNLLAFLVVISLYLFTTHNRDKLPSYILGIAAGIKLFPAIFIYLVWLRAGKRGVVFWLFGLATMQLPVFFVLGIDPFLHFVLQAIPYIQKTALMYTGNISFTATTYFLFAKFGTNGASLQDVLRYVSLLNIVLLVFVLVMDYKQYQKDGRLDFSVCSLLVVLCICSPTVWNHYLVLAYFPLLLGLKYALELPQRGIHLTIVWFLYVNVAMSHGGIDLNDYVFIVTVLGGVVVNICLLCWLFLLRRNVTAVESPAS